MGLIQSSDGFFVHYFSPFVPQAVSKNVIFVIDVSGSMSNEGKIVQTRDAMHTILGQLRAVDGFNIILFNDNVKTWRPVLTLASAEGIAAARAYVKDKVK